MSDTTVTLVRRMNDVRVFPVPHPVSQLSPTWFPIPSIFGAGILVLFFLFVRFRAPSYPRCYYPFLLRSGIPCALHFFVSWSSIHRCRVWLQRVVISNVNMGMSLDVYREGERN
jgi:hypothetical protein